MNVWRATRNKQVGQNSISQVGRSGGNPNLRQRSPCVRPSHPQALGPQIPAAARQRLFCSPSKSQKTKRRKFGAIFSHFVSRIFSTLSEQVHHPFTETLRGVVGRSAPPRTNTTPYLTLSYHDWHLHAASGPKQRLAHFVRGGRRGTVLFWSVRMLDAVRQAVQMLPLTEPKWV